MDRQKRVYRALLVVYPFEYRRDYGEPMAQLFVDRLRDEGGGPRTVLVWAQMLVDLLKSAFRERLETTMRSFRTDFVAAPTSFTRSSGSLALVSAGMWILGLAFLGLASWLPGTAGSSNPDQLSADGQTAAFILGALSLFAAGVLMIIAMSGVHQRHGSLGLVGMAGLGITGLGAAALLLIAWAFPVWMTLIGLGTLLFALPVGRRDIAPRLWTTIWGAGMAAGAAAWWVLRLLEVGTPDQFGDYPVAVAVGLPIGVLIMALGLTGVGMWLRSEEPSGFEPHQRTTTA